MLNLHGYVIPKRRKRKSARYNTGVIVRSLDKSSAVIFNRYRSPLVISAKHSSLNCAAGCIQGIVRNICEIGVGN